MANSIAVQEERPPYLFAALAALVVLLGYLVSLAPSVTFWDAGEFIAAAHILGIPHPPGTPLFVMLGRVWDVAIPGLSTAYSTNLMSAMFSAGSSGFLFLFCHAALAKGAEGMDAATGKLFRIGGAFAASLVAAFMFTNWQNSVETEVYQVAMFSIGLIAWLCWLWRRDRGGKRGTHELLLMVYVLGAALGNHLMALLVGPAVLAFMFYTLRTDPAKDQKERAVQWSEWGVAASLWVAMVGVGVASTKVIALGLILWAVAAYFAFRAKSGFFAIMALIVAIIGVSTYAFLYIRAGLHPFVNEADPSTLRNLWAVMGREQYPPRSPFDNPIYQSGDGNPGRFVMPFDFNSPSAGGSPSLVLVGLQIANYLQYFNWQFANAVQRLDPIFGPGRMLITLVFLVLGVLGAMEQRKWDKGVFWFHFVAWATTSVGLVIYLNFKPGFAIGFEWFPDREMHEVRERDYFFTVSFVFFGLWAGLGIAALFHRIRYQLGDKLSGAAPVFLLALAPFVLNFGAASRKQIPSAMLPRDFAYDMLQSVEPYGLLFTNGDNDTFPLWYAQEVEGIRQDVMVVNLSLINTDWYIRQLRDNPTRPYQPDSTALALYGRVDAPPPGCTPGQADTLDSWARAAGRRPPDRARGMAMCLHTLTDDQINSIVPQLLPRDHAFRAGTITHTYRAGTPFYVKDVLVLRLIQEQWGKRPIFFALTAGAGSRMDLDAYITQRALVYKLHGDTVSMGPGFAVSAFGQGQPPVDIAWTDRLVNRAYRYADLFNVPRLKLDPTDDNIANNLAFPIMSLGYGALQRNDLPGALREYERAAHLMPTNQLMQQELAQLRAVSAAPQLFDSAPPADTTKRR